MGVRAVCDGEPRPPWCTGIARFEVDVTRSSSRLIVATRCRLGGVGSDIQALLDTGAEWSLVGGEIAQALEKEADDEAKEMVMSTRLGSVHGRLHRLDVTLVADEGEDLCVSSSVLLAPSWDGPPVLGYHGFLERIRFGLDPGHINHEEQRFFFGGAR